MREGDRSYDSAEASHRALRGIRRELERHPAVSTAQGFPPGVHNHVVADVVPTRLESKVDDATLTVRWFAGETPEARPEFSFHYHDETGSDLGWHHEPNPHVEEWGHVQKRGNSEAEYAYEPYTFSSTNPTRVVWEVLSLLVSTL
jgi:hypothetical protein